MERVFLSATRFTVNAHSARHECYGRGPNERERAKKSEKGARCGSSEAMQFLSENSFSILNDEQNSRSARF